MSTNYYLHRAPCIHCKRGDERPTHIGKSNDGWCFLLRVYPKEGIHDLDDWLPLINEPGSIIMSEHGERVLPGSLLGIIRDRIADVAPTDQWLDDNQAIMGPNGLARLRIDRHVKHGKAWDCIDIDFE